MKRHIVFGAIFAVAAVAFQLIDPLNQLAGWSNFISGVAAGGFVIAAASYIRMKRARTVVNAK